MGDAMREDDLYISSLLDAMNYRFAPAQKPEFPGEREQDYQGGVMELVELQKEFGIFKTGRSLSTSFRVLGLGGVRNARARNRWLSVLRWLERTNSPTSGVSGDQAIVTAIIDDLESASAKPVYFTSHHDPHDPQSVLIELESTPIHYMKIDYITISIPLRPRTASAS